MAFHGSVRGNVTAFPNPVFQVHSGKQPPTTSFSLKIAFCTPFKPIDHPNVSGDVTIARDLYQTLETLGHTMIRLDHYPAKEIYWHPSRWARAGLAARKMIEQAEGADCWLTYGSYYKVPDVFGPLATTKLEMPYFLFQASYAVNRGKRLGTWPGYRLNRRAMLMADHIFCNRMNDMRGCAKLLPDDDYTYVRPGVPDGLFARDTQERERLRQEWGVDDVPVVMTAAMMRHGVKAEGLRWVIESCAALVERGQDLQLVIAGDGPQRQAIEAEAREALGDRVRFLGMVDRTDLGGVFSAGDIFAFPGLEESVGMVYLEAQQCGLPVVATDDEGAPHVVKHNVSGLITPVDKNEFTEAVGTLLSDTVLRQTMGRQAMEYVRRNHSASINYQAMARTMERIVLQGKLS